jgi:pimeloyl-ACP methyl ester carboxylesterase
VPGKREKIYAHCGGKDISAIGSRIGWAGGDELMQSWRESGFLIVLVSLILSSACAGSPGSAGAEATTSLAAAAAPCLNDDEVRTGQVDFPSADGAQLQGLLLIGRGPVGVVLAHESEADLCEWKPYAYALFHEGYRVLAFNFSDHLDRDVVGAVAELRARGSKEIVLIGASMGGTAVLAAAAEVTPPVSAVVSLSGPRDFDGVDALAAVPRLGMPVLFVAGSEDSPFANDARAMYAATTAPGRQLLVVQSGGHGIELMNTVVTSVLEKFIRAHVHQPARPSP